MNGLQRLACLIGSAAALVLSASGCDPYTYFNVHITIDPAIDNNGSTTLREVDSCATYVFADGKQIEKGEVLTMLNGTHACKTPDTGKDASGIITYDLGVMDYSSARSSGTIKFLINMQNLQNQSTVQGSGEGPVSPGRGERNPVNVLIKAEPCPNTCDTCQPTCPEDTSSYR